MMLLKTGKIMKRSIITAILTSLSFAGYTHAGEITLTSGQTKVGQLVPRGDGSITANTDDGTFTYKVSQYTRAVGDRPAEFDAARSSLNKSDWAGLKSNADAAMRSGAFLEWDAHAASVLAEGYIRQKKGVEANQTIKTIVDRYLKVMKTETEVWDRFPKLESISWRAQTLQGSKHDELEDVLSKVISDAKNRERAAFAQMVRGDLRLEQKRAKEAVLDYLRTVYFFAGMEDVHPEAIYKAGKAFEAMQNTKRAAEFFNRLTSEYPESSYAAEVAGK
jgi:tetratricopeptide (TPR) repeat protein